MGSLFWPEDQPRELRKRGGAAKKGQSPRKRASAPRSLAPVPETGWVMPQALPRLEAAKILAIDVETKDPNIKTHGPGDCRGDGFIAGISVCTEDRHYWYFPMRHENGPNMDPEVVLRWARDELCRPHQPKIGANIMYDLGWLAAEGVHVEGEFDDVQFAEPLLNEHAGSYALGTLSEKYLGTHGKGEAEERLYQWCAQSFGGKPTRGDQAKNIWRAPAQLVGPYAEFDVYAPFEILEQQKKALEREELLGVYDLERKLIPMLVAMRRRGVRVDIERAERVRAALVEKRDRIVHGLGGIDIWASESIAVAFDREGIEYPRTATGKPSFRKGWLEKHDAAVANQLMLARKYDKAVGTFLDGHILGSHNSGVVHASLHPLRKADEAEGEAGTVSGRFSCSNPNLQQVTSRDEELAPLIRGVFVPHEGDPGWRRHDYSQIEYRLFVNIAKGPGAEEARERFRNDPTTDYHDFTQDLVHRELGIELARKPIKNINFGTIFGMGEGTLQAMLGLSSSAARQFFDAYDAGVPYAKKTLEYAARIAAERGYIRTVSGRRARFPFWEPAKYSRNQRWYATEEEAREAAKGGPIRRARTHKSLNAYTQGSGADIMKRAMLALWESGVCEVVGIPLITVHDELNWSDPCTAESEEAFAVVRGIMEVATRISVPILVDEEKGPNWGECK